MSSVSTIDVSVKDGGLGALLKSAGTPEEVQQYLTETCQITSRQEFLDYVVRANFETELKEILATKFPVSDQFTIEKQRLYVTKARGAYRLALELDKYVVAQFEKQVADRGEADVEKPLDAATLAVMKQDWANFHKWTPVKSMRAAPNLRNRVYREFKNFSMTLHTVNKALTVEHARRPVESSKVPLGPAGSNNPVHLETTTPPTRQVTTLLQYFSALRLLMGNYAYCGSYQAPSKSDTNKSVTFFPWEDALGYCDDTLQATIRIDIPEASKLAWLRARDESTRSEMVSLINEGWPGGEALHKARKIHAHYWRMEDKVSSSVQDDDATLRNSSPPPAKRARTDRE